MPPPPASSPPHQAPATNQDDAANREPVTRWGRPSAIEIGIVILATLIGGLARFGAASDSFVEHFDEGVYASNLFSGPDTGYRFPNQHLYAPPLHPALIEWGMILFGLRTGPMLPAATLGALTIPLLWWVVRAWLGPLTALLAMVMLACDAFHIAHSASALTDVPVTFWMLLAVWWLASGVEQHGWWRTVAGGVVCGIAWWTKYSGWLPLAIVGSAVLVSGMVERSGWRETRTRLGYWLGGGVVATAVWSPWLWELQGLGGYQVVAANHRGYVVGWSGWWLSAREQVEHLRLWGGWPKFLGLDYGTALIFGSVCGVACALWRSLRGAIVSRETGDDDRSGLRPLPPGGLGSWSLMAWWAGLALTIPLYEPYPRLLLPWIIPACVWLLYGLVTLLKPLLPDGLRGAFGDAPVSRETNLWPVRAAFGMVSVVVLLGSYPPLSRPPRGVGMWSLAQQVAERVTVPMPAGLDPRDAAIYVYGEPSLVYHLRLRGYENAVPTSHLGFARTNAPASPLPTFVVIGPHARESSRFAEQWGEVAPDGGPTRLVLVETFPIRVSRLVALDHRPPRYEEEFALYRVE